MIEMLDSTKAACDDGRKAYVLLSQPFLGSLTGLASFAERLRATLMEGSSLDRVTELETET